MKTFFLLFFCFACFSLPAQSEDYEYWVSKAVALFSEGDAKAAAEAYSTAFATLGWRGKPDDRYAAARAWAQAGVPDSAFFQLTRMVDRQQFRDEARLREEPDFALLHSDFRWTRLLTKIRQSVTRETEMRNSPLVLELEEIHRLDQWYRVKRDSVLSVYAKNSEAYKKYMRDWIIQDSLNCARICGLLDQYGWLGPNEVGDYANKAFFLVIQHAELPIQEKYFPLMQQAVKMGKASAADLAYLEDRILMRQGKPQRYGSQIQSDPKTGAWVLYPVEDPEQLDARRASVGLGPISKYLEMTGAVWKQ
jgi:hypothetical protein